MHADDGLRALSATLDDIDQRLGEMERWISGPTGHEDLVRALDQVLRTIEDLRRLRGQQGDS